MTDIPVGWFDEKAACSQIVIANTATNKIEVYRPCRTDVLKVTQWNDVSLGYVAPVHVALPTGAVLAGPVYVADVDHDGHLDLVSYDRVGIKIQLDVAYGDGTGQFGSTSGEPPDGMAETHLCLTGLSSTPRTWS